MVRRLYLPKSVGKYSQLILNIPGNIANIKHVSIQLATSNHYSIIFEIQAAYKQSHRKAYPSVSRNGMPHITEWWCNVISNRVILAEKLGCECECYVAAMWRSPKRSHTTILGYYLFRNSNPKKAYFKNHRTLCSLNKFQETCPSMNSYPSCWMSCRQLHAALRHFWPYSKATRRPSMSMIVRGWSLSCKSCSWNDKKTGHVFVLKGL